MSDVLTVLQGSGLRPKPAIPSQSQTIPCPPGYIGAGQQQSRVCTWNVATQAWSCTEWVTDVFGCSPASVVYVGPAKYLTGYTIYSGPPVAGVPSGGVGLGVAYYTQALTVGGYSATLYGEYWMNPFGFDPSQPNDNDPVGYRHEIRDVNPLFEGNTATLIKGLKPGGDGQTATVTGGVASFAFFANDDDSVKDDEQENMTVQVG